MLSTKQNNNQWIIAGIKVSYKHKKSLCILNKTTNSPIIKAFCTQYSTRLWKVIGKSKHLYYNELIKTSRNENKTVWKIIYKETGKSSLAKNIPMELNLRNRFQNNHANDFNKNYLNIIDDRKIQQANIKSTKFSLKEAFYQHPNHWIWSKMYV